MKKEGRWEIDCDGDYGDGVNWYGLVVGVWGLKIGDCIRDRAERGRGNKG